MTAEPADQIHSGARFPGSLIPVLQRHPKRIVFPEGNDPRILRTAAALVKSETVAPILLGNRRAIQALAAREGIPLDFVGILEPEQTDDFTVFCERYRRTERVRRQPAGEPAEVMANPLYFAAMMVQYGYADGIVGGNQALPAAYFRGLFHVIARQPGKPSASSCMPLFLPHRPDLGVDGTLLLGDCAVVPSPTVEQMAMTAVEAAKAATLLLNARPRVAMISFSTRASASDPSTRKVAAATALARQLAAREHIEMDIDGELQIDAALDPGAAGRKAPGSPLHGRANVLIFPELTAAHSAFKLLEVVAGARPCGQQILGLTRPATQVSRVASDFTIHAAALTTAARAIAYHARIEAGDFPG